jgi:hypothetical protein
LNNIQRLYLKARVNQKESEMIYRFLRFSAFILCIFLLILTGCASTKPSKFFVLSSLSTSDKAQQVASSGNGVSIGVGPLKLPDHLNRPQIVTRTSQNELKITQFNRWAGSLREDFSLVLAENLSILLSTDRVVVIPWRRSIQIDYQVAVDVVRFDGALGENVLLKANWTIFGEGGKKAILMRASNIKEETDGRGYDEYVAAQSRALAELSQEIAYAIKSIKPEASE